MQKYPVLRMIVLYGKAGALVVTLALAAMIVWLGWPMLGGYAIVVAAFAAAICAILSFSFVELVVLITEMLLPQA